MRIILVIIIRHQPSRPVSLALEYCVITIIVIFHDYVIIIDHVIVSTAFFHRYRNDHRHRNDVIVTIIVTIITSRPRRPLSIRFQLLQLFKLHRLRYSTSHWRGFALFPGHLRDFLVLRKPPDHFDPHISLGDDCHTVIPLPKSFRSGHTSADMWCSPPATRFISSSGLRLIQNTPDLTFLQIVCKMVVHI